MKFGDDLLQPLRVFTFSFLVCVLFSACGGTGTQDKLYQQVQELAAQNEENSSFDVVLSDFTGFDWDTAVVFKYPASGEEMEAATGVKYPGSLDMTYGIFFVNDQKIVYEELFPKDVETLSRFMIYPHSGNVGDEPHFGVFTPDSVFTCSITESNNDTFYSLKPVDSGGNTIDSINENR